MAVYNERVRWQALAVVLGGCGFHGATVGDATEPRDAPARDAEVMDAAGDATLVDALAAPIALRQINDASSGTNIGAITVKFAQAQQAGDLNVVVVGWYMAGAVASVVDTSGNAYAIAAGPAIAAPESQLVYYKCGIAAAAANANAVTVTFAGATQQPDVHAIEYSGIRSTACLDTAVSATASGAAMDVGPLATTHAHDLLVAATFQTGRTTAADPAYVNRGIDGFGDLVEDREVAATGSFHALATQDTSAAWVMQLVAFEGM